MEGEVEMEGDVEKEGDKKWTNTRVSLESPALSPPTFQVMSEPPNSKRALFIPFKAFLSAGFISVMKLLYHKTRLS